MPDKIPFIIYLSDEDYEVALSFHIQDMIELNQSTLQNNQLFQSKTKKWFDRKFIHKQTNNFKVGDLVLFNVKNRVKDLKLG